MTYDAELLIKDINLESPVVFQRRGLRGLPVFIVLVDDIPKNMPLEYSVDYKKEELMTLSDGTDANYVEVNWSIPSRETLTTLGVFAYKNNKDIGVVTGSVEESSIENLAKITKSLKITK